MPGIIKAWTNHITTHQNKESKRKKEVDVKHPSPWCSSWVVLMPPEASLLFTLGRIRFCNWSKSGFCNWKSWRPVHHPHFKGKTVWFWEPRNKWILGRCICFWDIWVRVDIMGFTCIICAVRRFTTWDKTSSIKVLRVNWNVCVFGFQETVEIDACLYFKNHLKHLCAFQLNVGNQISISRIESQLTNGL